MSFKLKDLQDLAEVKAREYFMEKGYYCTPSTLLAINDALKGVDDVNYADPIILKATSALPIGFGVYEGPCGAVSAGYVAIGLKFGTSEPDEAIVFNALKKSAEWLRWLFSYYAVSNFLMFEILHAYLYKIIKHI